MPFATGPTVANLKLPSPQDLTSQVIVLDGLNVATADGSHEAGMGALWTGVENTGNGAAGKGPSIDQAIAGSLGGTRPFASLPLMVRDSQDFTDRSVQTRMCYDATDFIDPYDDPIAALEAVFLQAPAGRTAARAPIAKQDAIRSAVFRRQIELQELTHAQRQAVHRRQGPPLQHPGRVGRAEYAVPAPGCGGP